MIVVRRAAERGVTDLGWLDSKHTFSFGDYYDPAHPGFRNLRVINDDVIAPGTGFGLHGHRDMEIVTYILEGALVHEDSLGNREVLRAGEVQRMSAGSGIQHSEVNASESERLHLLQIWILPSSRGLSPSYEQRPFPLAEEAGHWVRLAAPGGKDGALSIHADASVYGARLPAHASLESPLGPSRPGWLQVARGGVDVGGHRLEAGDGFGVRDEPLPRVTALAESELLLFDLA